MRSTLAILALTVALGTGRAFLAGQRADVSLWVTFGDSDQLVEIDVYTFKEIRRITTDPRPHGLASSPDGSKIYVGSDRTGNFQVIDARSGKIVGSIPLGKDPNQMTLTRDGRFAYMPMRGENSVAIIELDPLRLVKKVPMNEGPHDAYTTADGSRIYVGAQYGNAVAVFEPATHTLLHQIPTADGVRPIEPSHDGKTLYTALSNLIGFVVVSPARQEVVKRVELAKLPDGVPKPYLNTYTHALQLVKNDSELWLTDCVNDLIRIVRTSDLTEVAQIRVGKFPHWIAVRPDGRVLFVSLWDSNAVAVIDIASRRVLENIQFPRGSGPKRIMVAPQPH
jgi:YVTN family beta-propeller protein